MRGRIMGFLVLPSMKESALIVQMVVHLKPYKEGIVEMESLTEMRIVMVMT